MKKKKKTTNLPKLRKNDLPVGITVDKIAESLKENAGLISYSAQKLGLPLDVLKYHIKKSKYLRSILFDIRDSNIDIVENEVMNRIKDKKDPILMMFYLKCMGKDRGWVEKSEKAGDRPDRPIHIKIMPVAGLNMPDMPRKAGRPPNKATYAETKVLTSGDDDFIDAEVID